MAAFDPTQPFNVVGGPAPAAPATFDPGKPFDVVGEDTTGGDGGQHSLDQPVSGVSTAAPSESWGDVAADAVGNVLPSAAHVAEEIYSAVRHPVDTITSMANVGRGAGQELAHSLTDKPSIIDGAAPTHQLSPQEQAFEGLKNYFGGRYGSMEGFKHALATDPAGVATDLSVLFSGGETAASKMPMLSGKVADTLGTAAKITNPVAAIASGAGKVAKPLGNVAAKVIGDITTGAGSKSIKGAFQAGLAGGDAAKTFTGNMRGNIPWSQVVTDAKTALGNMRAQRNAAYRSGMADISKDATVLDFKPVDDALENVKSINSFKGQDLSPNTTAVRQDIFSTIADWKALDPAEYHTPEGFDALKQKIGDIKDAQPFGTPQRTIASDAYNAVRNTIADQAPTYDKVMSGYSQASDQLSELQKELSLGKNGNPNTALRKLQSTMRDNVNTSFGNRTKLAETLSANGAPNLMPALAGQALSTPIPRGLAKYGDLGAVAGIGMANIPAAAGVLAASSPRLMGEAAYGLGRTGRALAPVAKATAPLWKYGAQNAPLAYETETPLSLQNNSATGLADAIGTLSTISQPRAKGGRARGGGLHADQWN